MKFYLIIVLVLASLTMQGCAALVGGAAGAAVYGAAENADEDEEIED